MKVAIFAEALKKEGEIQYTRVNTVEEVFYMRKKGVVITVVVILAVAAVVAVVYGVLTSKKQDDLKNAFAEKITQDIVQGEDLPNDIQYENKVLEHTSFEMLSVNANEHTITVSITYPDCLKIADGYTGSADSTQEFYEYAISVLDGDQRPSLTEEIEVSYQEEDDGTITFEDSEALTNALTGGTYSLLVQMMEDK